MKSRLAAVLALFLVAASAAAQYRQALPGYHYNFPSDHFNHPEFQTEWWYYTGNVKEADGRSFGFQMTFFRQGIHRSTTKESPWAVEDLYLAHLALSDMDGRIFQHRERLNRAGPGIAGIDKDTGTIWNGNWSVQWSGNRQHLTAVADTFALDLVLAPRKPPVIHGVNGVSQKSEKPGQASHYISFTRLSAAGTIRLNGNLFTVEGTAWMDHEFFTNPLDPEQTGWDWLSLQLSDNTELMLFHLRRKGGGIDAYSSGTYVDAQGNSTHLQLEDFALEPRSERWTSPTSGAAYPIHWRVRVASLGLDLDLTTPLAQQEMSGNSAFAPNYWEGAIRIAGTRRGSPIAGVGYLEMTGYDRPVSLNR